MTKFGTNLSVVIEELQSKDVEQDAKDVDLQNQINSEVTARVDGDKLLQNSIDVEVAARTDSDKQLQSNIDVESDARKSVDQDLQEQINALNIAGTVQYFARQTAPAGWLKADGSAVSRTQYDKLFAAVGTMFGAGDGSTTFNLPDLRGEFIRGFDDGRGVDLGRTLGTQQGDGNKKHAHAIISNQCNSRDDFTFPDGMNGYYIHNGVYPSVAGKAGQEVTPACAVSYNGGTEARPRNIALLACIKY